MVYQADSDGAYGGLSTIGTSWLGGIDGATSVCRHSVIDGALAWPAGRHGMVLAQQRVIG
ncbi:hypothetical protein [Dyella sp. GSA-30]|jgi:hypothetical protein|uniref:hypothetical protein n=1 Tax=Dyella sp. GSA-30 TaxID=2994496 RepID=UPI002490D84B|nr:hypothetical protein [Dyella sp. GSA-30]BDU21019.1 hypothetical protein DYGSA30_24760 [Dyella sp. GSA-30]